MTPFTIERAESADHALALLAAHGHSARLYAGGVHLVPLLRKGSSGVDLLVDVKHIPGMTRINGSSELVRIGGAVTHRTVSHSPELRTRCPELSRGVFLLGNPRVRAAGTIGGNLSSGVRESDVAVLVVAHDGRVEIDGPTGPEERTAEDWLRDPALHRLVSAVLIPVTARRTVRYRRFPPGGSPSAAAAAVVDRSRARRGLAIVAGCAGGPVVRIRLDDVAEADADAEIVRLAAERAQERVEVGPGEGCSAEYRRHLVGVMAARAMGAALGTEVA